MLLNIASYVVLKIEVYDEERLLIMQIDRKMDNYDIKWEER